MNYTYKLTNGNMILRVDDGIWIPKSESNRHYQEYLLWLEEGNTPLPPDPLPEPEPLTPEQKLAQAGLTIEELKSLLGL
jgi:hypothetical protein